MRADLHTMEQIDLYLQGKLTGEELRQFENALSSNPELQSLVSDQQLLIQTVSRKALLAEIHAVAGVGGTAWYANPYVGIAGATLVVGGILSVVYFTSDNDQPENPVLANEQVITSDSLNSTELITETGTVYYADSDTAIFIEANTSHSSHATPNMLNDPSSLDDSPEFPIGDNNDDAVTTQTSSDDHSDDGQTATVDADNNLAKNRLASYPKGDLALKEFINENMRFPGTAREKKLSGNVKVKFLVTPEGTRTNIEAVCFNMRDENDKPLTSTQMVLNQKIANLFEREATRIIRIMPAWVPATDSQGNPVLMPVEMYFNFSLHDGNSTYRLD